MTLAARQLLQEIPIESRSVLALVPSQHVPAVVENVVQLLDDGLILCLILHQAFTVSGSTASTLLWTLPIARAR